MSIRNASEKNGKEPEIDETSYNLISIISSEKLKISLFYIRSTTSIS